MLITVVKFIVILTWGCAAVWWIRHLNRQNKETRNLQEWLARRQRFREREDERFLKAIGIEDPEIKS